MRLVGAKMGSSTRSGLVASPLRQTTFQTLCPQRRRSPRGHRYSRASAGVVTELSRKCCQMKSRNAWRKSRATRLCWLPMKYLAPALLVLGLIATACTDSQREVASQTQSPNLETAPSPTPEPPSAEEMLIDSQSARIAALKEHTEVLRENIESLESTVDDLESKNQEAAQLIVDLEAEGEEAALLIDDLEAESEGKGQLAEDLRSEISEKEEMLEDLRCRSYIDIELVSEGCDWEPPDSMPWQIGGWTLRRWDTGDTLIITYEINDEGTDSRSLSTLSASCVRDANPEAFIQMDVGGVLHEAERDTVYVDYRIGDTERFEVPWSSLGGNTRTTLLPAWGYGVMVLDDLRTGEGTMDVTVSAADGPPFQAAFEIDGIAEVLDMLEPGCGNTNSALRGNSA